ncbi:uncharacterized mitochondrial protein AtMg00810-like [Hibiscus syriacus]|uniref:uncharacterized mitochondrial protein AtMg00810-like n=1 Tax=Hibiscus syriacus TaxID=106335 RepID=UPI0019226DBF|nr:uncharacterized mitochondrial protein AtMg00810-like [Hibiscus syriacus]
MDKSSHVVTPMILSKLQPNVGELLCDARECHSIVGALLYVCHTRPDITFSMNQVAQYMHARRQGHLVVVKRILRYLVSTLDYGLVLSPYGVNVKVVAFVYADWGGNPDDRKLIYGHCVFVGDNLVSWASKKQKTVSSSTMEVEYRSVDDATAKVTWVDVVLSDMGIVRQGCRLFGVITVVLWL